METLHNRTVMVTGDSMTQGSEGDFTWRYRLWCWLESTPGPAIEFVGPYKGTQAQVGPRGPQPPKFLDDADCIEEAGMDGRYARDVDADWYNHSSHFSSWGYRAAQAKDAILEHVRTYQPDYLLVALGFNDMGWGFSDARGLIETVTELVANARQGKSDIRIILATVPHRTYMDGRDDLVENTDEYNRRVRHLVASLNTSTSPIKLAEFEKHYDSSPSSSPASYDGLHPNALGEYQIAAAFSSALQAFSLRPSTHPLTIPAHVPDPAPDPIINLQAHGFPTGIRVTWSSSFGARAYDVRTRTPTARDWTLHAAVGPRLDTTCASPGETWEYAVRASRGDAARFKGAWSAPVSAVSRKATAPAPAAVSITPTARGCVAVWDAVAEERWAVERYELMLWDRDTPGAFFEGYGVRGTRAEMTALKAGHRYDAWVKTWATVEGEVAVGDPRGARPFVPGGEALEKPGALGYEVKDGLTVRLSWTGARGAAAYLVYKRNVLDTTAGFETDGEYVYDTTREVGLLFPGVGCFDFYIVAVNGELESGPSNKVRPDG